MLSLIGFDVSPFQEVCIATDIVESANSMRKPSPKFAFHVMKKYNILNDNLFIVGNNISDVGAAISANCNSIWFSSAWSVKSEDSNISYDKLYKVNTFEKLTDIIMEDFGS